MENEQSTSDKTERVLDLYTKLLNGAIVKKAEEANNYGVNERTIQRDIDDIRRFMDKSVGSSGIVNSVIYDRTRKGFRLEQLYQMRFSNAEILAICKILLDSRAFTKKEMVAMLDKLLDCCVPKENQKLVKDLISNEEYHYIEPRHKSVFIDKMWLIGQAIQQHKYIEVVYTRLKDKKVVNRKVMPVAIMFSEFYFYMAAFIDDEATRADFDVLNDSFPTIYRIDRIRDVNVMDEHYRVPYANRFEEGEFRKRIQFMYGGKLRKVKFRYTGLSVEAVLDKLPTAEIIDEENGTYVIRAEVFGDGIDMWLRSQGDNIDIVERG